MSNKKAPDTKAKLDWIARKGEREREGEQHTQSRTKTKTETIGVLISVRVQLQFRVEGERGRSVIRYYQLLLQEFICQTTKRGLAGKEVRV